MPACDGSPPPLVAQPWMPTPLHSWWHAWCAHAAAVAASDPLGCRSKEHESASSAAHLSADALATGVHAHGAAAADARARGRQQERDEREQQRNRARRHFVLGFGEKKEQAGR
jgi:hypothetical protein